MSYLLIIFSVVAFHLPAFNTNPTNWKVVQVVRSEQKILDNGYIESFETVVLPNEHWDGLGHFKYIYYKGLKICRCSVNEVVFSPNGEQMIFTDGSTGELRMFFFESNSSRVVSTEFQGYPSGAQWDIHKREVFLTLKKWNSVRKGFDVVEFDITY